MGKDSLLKATSKKKDEKEKAKSPKKVVTAKKTAGKSKATSKAKKAPQAKATTKPRPQKAARVKKPKVSRRDLLSKKFEKWEPEKVFKVEPDKEYVQNFVSPPFVTNASEAEVRRVKELLFKKFDLQTEEKIRKVAKSIKTKAASFPETSPADDLPPQKKESDPFQRAIIVFITVFVLLIALIIGTSYSNKGKYYIQEADGAVEVWQGTFDPMGKELVISLPGGQPPRDIRNVYSKSEIFPLISSYYIDRADSMLDVPGLFDFEGIRVYLNTAMFYAITEKLHSAISRRLNTIDLMMIMYRADVSISKGTKADLEVALGYLFEAVALDLDKNQADLLEKKIKSVNDLLANLDTK